VIWSKRGIPVHISNTIQLVVDRNPLVALAFLRSMGSAQNAQREHDNMHEAGRKKEPKKKK
jgi:hypothetical protein